MDRLPAKPGPSVPTQTAIRRLTADYKNLIADPLPSVIAHPTPDNIFKWHYLIYGSPGSLYEDFHPEKWNPSWTVSSILMAFVSFMNDKEYNHAGGMKTTDQEKQKLAKESRDFNLRNPKFREIFEELIPLLEMDDDEDFDLSDEDTNDAISDSKE
uniref:UBC core domain-containing protein n=1 Tax=Panagrolaimus davidi TaxID=227884 RepID=A0A914QHW8_9BILA